MSEFNIVDPFEIKDPLLDVKRPKTTIQEESGFQSIPSGSRVRTKLTDTGAEVEGYAYPEFNTVTIGHTPLYMKPKSKQQPLTFARGAELIGGGANKSIANTLGMPADAIGAALGIQNPVGGSQFIQNMLPKPPAAPQGFAENTLQAVGEQLPFLAVPAAQGAKTGQALQNFRRMIPSAIGQGSGIGAARTIAPDSLGAELTGAILGGGITAPRTLAGGILGEAGERLSSKPLMKASQAITPAIDDIDTAIARDYTKAVRPTVSGKETISDWKKAQNQAVGAVKQILTNAREKGTPIPTDLESFGEAVGNAKQQVFKKYHAMANETGEKGALVDVSPLVNDLRRIAADKLSKYGKGAVSHAEELADQLASDRYFTPEEAEKLISIWNNQLKAFYKGQSGDLSATTASVTDSAARYLRAALDDAIERYTGTGYQDLKNKYGQLRSIEKDVTNRAIVDARKAPVGLIDFTDMFSLSKAAYAAAKLDPAMALGAGAVYGFKKFIKGLNDPNKIVNRMFKNADKYIERDDIPWDKLSKGEERMFTTNTRQPDGVTNPRGVVPIGRPYGPKEQIIEGEYRTVTPLSGGQRAGLLESPRSQGTINAPWKPVLRTGANVDRFSNIQEPPKTIHDIEAMAKQLYEMGYPPEVIREKLQSAYELAKGVK